MQILLINGLHIASDKGYLNIPRS